MTDPEANLPFELKVASIPNCYIFHLTNGKVAIVQIGKGQFHVAVDTLRAWLAENAADVSITESNEFRPNNAGWQLIHTNGELFIELVVSQ